MNNLRIRKLTPKECFRLMGVKDEDSNKLIDMSNATKYHLAGDSIVVNVLESIFKSILIDNRIVKSKPIRLIELFSGYGSQALSLKYLGIDFESWRTCEWAIKSIEAYKKIHHQDINEDFSGDLSKENLVEVLYNLGISSNWNEPMKLEQIKRKSEEELRNIYNNIIITKNMVNIQKATANDLDIRERENYNYIMTYSFPCQDLSLAGKGEGMKRDSGTRSGMLWEVQRLLEECDENLPQILLMENVPQVIGKKNKQDFDEWVQFLESKGYTNKYCLLNAKEIGYPEPIPQNRNRCFMVSVLNPINDIVFPKKTERKLVLKDLLEQNVDEKYYLSDKMVKYISATGTLNFNNHDSKINLDIARPLTTDPNKRAGTTNYLSKDLPNNYDLNECVRLGGIFDTDKETHQAGSIYDKNGLSPTLDTMQGGYRQPCIVGDSTSNDNFIVKNKVLKETLEQNEIEDGISYIDGFNRNIRKDDLSGTITTRINASNNTFFAIKNATKQGYLEATDGDGVDISSRMQYHRGTVQKDIIQTIDCQGGESHGVVVKDEIDYTNDL